MVAWLKAIPSLISLFMAVIEAAKKIQADISLAEKNKKLASAITQAHATGGDTSAIEALFSKPS